MIQEQHIEVWREEGYWYAQFGPVLWGGYETLDALVDQLDRDHGGIQLHLALVLRVGS